MNKKLIFLFFITTYFFNTQTATVEAREGRRFDLSCQPNKRIQYLNSVVWNLVPRSKTRSVFEKALTKEINRIKQIRALEETKYKGEAEWLEDRISGASKDLDQFYASRRFRDVFDSMKRRSIRAPH